jgi:hypothetical protein
VDDRVDVSGAVPEKVAKHWWQRATVTTTERDWTPASLPAPRPLVIRAERV